jgi:hypothetical protein
LAASGRPLDPGHRHHGNVVVPSNQSLTAPIIPTQSSVLGAVTRLKLFIVLAFSPGAVTCRSEKFAISIMLPHRCICALVVGSLGHLPPTPRAYELVIVL